MRAKSSTLGTKIVTCGLVLAMLVQTQLSKAAPVVTAPPPPQTKDGKPQPEVLAVCIAVGIVVGIGIGGAYVIYRLCQLFPPPPVAPPPPPVVIPPPPTNAPPVVTNPPPPIVVARAGFGLLDGPPLPGGTNPPPPYNTNLVNMAHEPYYWVPPQWASNTVAVTETHDNQVYYNVSSYGWTETNSGSALLVKAYGTGTIASLQSSTNLTDWGSYTFQAWISDGGVITVLADGQGQPIMTNYGATASGHTGATNAIGLGVWVGNESSKFHRALLAP